MLIGASGDFTDGDGNPASKEQHFARLERDIGGTFDVFHDFLQWRDLTRSTWPGSASAALAAEGRTLFVNLKSPTGRPDDWRAIADGRYDADIERAATQMAAHGRPVFLTFFHEPEDNIRSAAGGDDTRIQAYIDDYRNAFRHLHDRFDHHGADNVIWVWDMVGWLPTWASYYERGLYPGDDVVDWVAWNPYNWFGCVNHGSPDRWRTFTETVAPFYDWLGTPGPGRPSTDKPLMLGEFGTEENTGAVDSNQTKADWLDEARRRLPERFPRLKAVIYFDAEGRRADGSVQFCRWSADSSPASAAAIGRLVNDPALDPVWP